MKKKLLILWLLLLFFPIISYAASNPYPKTQTFNGVVSTPCTRVAWQEVYDRLGIALPSWGNAVDWYRNAANAGYQVGSEAKPNSIAVYSGFYDYGHVAFVVSVSDETMYVVENKGSGEGKTEGNRSKGIGSGEQSGLYLIGFIYVTEAKTTIPKDTTSIDTPSKSSNSYLKKIIVNNQELDVQKDNYYYTLEYPFDIDNVTLKVEVENQKAKATYQENNSLKVGENILNILVTAEDGSESTYILNVKRDVEEVINEEENEKVVQEKEETNQNKDAKIIWHNYYLVVIVLLIFLVDGISIFLHIKNRKKK